MISTVKDLDFYLLCMELGGYIEVTKRIISDERQDYLGGAYRNCLLNWMQE